MAGAGAKPFVDNRIRQRKIMLFAKKHDPQCKTIRKMLDEYKLHHTNYEVAEIDSRQDCTQIENYFQIICLTDSRSVSTHFLLLYEMNIRLRCKCVGIGPLPELA